jgi:hypothetical protein
MKKPKTIEAAQRAEITKELKSLQREQNRLGFDNDGILSKENIAHHRLMLTRDKAIKKAEREYGRACRALMRGTKKILKGNQRRIADITKRIAILEGRLS